MSDPQTGPEQFQKDSLYYESNVGELLDRYPEQWGAILNERVVAVSDDPFLLVQILKDKSLPSEWAVIEHLTLEEELLIL